ncbi:MAG: hypothetical protein Fues2KO_45650 [Fuerstiella sp.]
MILKWGRSNGYLLWPDLLPEVSGSSDPAILSTLGCGKPSVASVMRSGDRITTVSPAAPESDAPTNVVAGATPWLGLLNVLAGSPDPASSRTAPER